MLESILEPVLGRTLFYRLPPIGVGTPEVESFRAYVRRLAFEHSLKPTTLLRLLLKTMPIEGAYRKVAESAAQEFDFGPTVGPQILSRMEAATGVALEDTTTLRFARLLSTQGLLRDMHSAHCPQCVKETGDIAHGRLAWELSAVTACPRHGVRLHTNNVCGALESERLAASSRPALNCVCKTCGSIGFDCVKEAPVAASDFEIWTAKQVGELVAAPVETIHRMTPATVQAGLAATVAGAFGGSVVNAAKRAGLSRSSVCVWVRGDFSPSLPGLAKLCYAGGASLVGLMAGRFESLAGEHCGRDMAEVPKRKYRKSELTPGEIRAATLAAAKEAVPPSPAALGKRLGLNKDTIRVRFPEEGAVLLAAHREYKARDRQRRYQSAVEAYESAATTLLDGGKVVGRKNLQQLSGLNAFRTNELRSLAMHEVMNRLQHASTVEQVTA